jgi:hypothetical protein
MKIAHLPLPPRVKITLMAMYQFCYPTGYWLPVENQAADE